MSEINLDLVRFRNFMSFGNSWTEVNLRSRGTTFIVGENLDEGGSSGAGKTTTINAIAYALYDRVLDKHLNKDQLINTTNAKQNTLMEVELYMRRGDQRYVIKRWRGAESGVKLLEEGHPLDPKHEPVMIGDVVFRDVTPAAVNRGEDNFNKKVIELFGFSYELFSRIILFEGNSVPFLSQTAGIQRYIIEELLRIRMLTQKANYIKKQIQLTEKDIDVQKMLIKQQELQNESQLKRIADAEERVKRWEKGREEDFTMIQAEIQKLSDVDFETEEQLHAEIQALQQEFDAFKPKFDALTTRLAAKQREVSPAQAELSILISGIGKKRKDHERHHANFTHLRDAKCPFCMQAFTDPHKMQTEGNAWAVLEQEIKLDEQLIDQHERRVAEDKAKIAVEMREIQAEIQGLTEERMQINAAIQEVKSAVKYPTLTAALKAKNSVTALNEKFMKRAQETNPHLETVAALKSEGLVTINRDALDQLIKFHEHQKFLVKLLTDKNSYIRKNIIAKTIPFLNKRIGFYTEKLNLPHIILFQPDMSCHISQYGRELGHGNLSNGEKKRLNLALCLAFRDTLTYLHSKVNVLFTDEVDGGSLGQHEVDLLISLLKRKAWDDEISIFIISHRPEFDGRCDRNLVVRKEAGFSQLIPQPD